MGKISIYINIQFINYFYFNIFAKASTTGNVLKLRNFEKSYFIKLTLKHVWRNGIMSVICFQMQHKEENKRELELKDTNVGKL